MIGKILGGRYELLELIGVGGMSHVYKARCILLNRYVAVKILKDEFNEDKEFIKRFYIESQAAASLSSPHIVSVYDVGEEDSIHYIVMEYVEGVTLKEVIKANGVLAWNVALNFSLQILSALECAHKNGIVHRDIKPLNIIVTDDGVLKVTDFGIARAVNNNETKKIDSDVIGSVHYISPEQAKGIMIDARCDIYSLGIVMYEMLTGKLPYDGDNPVSVALMHLSSEPVSIKELNISVPNELVRIVTKSMQRDVVNRYQSAKEMSAELTEFKKLENLTTKENEDAFVLETIEMVNLARRDAGIELPGRNQRAQSQGAQETIVQRFHDDAEDIPKAKKKKKKSEKSEKTAFWTAIGASTAIVLVVAFLIISMFFPNMKSKNNGDEVYYLTNMEGQNFYEVRDKLEEAGFEIIVNEVRDDSKEDGTILKQSPYGNISVKVSSTVLEFDIVGNDSTGEKVAVPRVTNKRKDQAVDELTKAGLTVRVVEEESATTQAGYVFRQDPIATSIVKKGSEVIVYVSKKDGNSETITVPDFVGMEKDAATKKAAELGFTVVIIEKESSSNIGKVTSQSLKKGDDVGEGTTIQLTVAVEKATPSAAPSPTPTTTPTATPTATPTTTPTATPTATPTTTPTATPDSGGETASPVSNEVVSKSWSVDLPQDKDSATVVAKRDGVVVYQQECDTSSGTVNVSVRGSGTQTVEITVDGQVFINQSVSFN